MKQRGSLAKYSKQVDTAWSTSLMSLSVEYSRCAREGYPPLSGLSPQASLRLTTVLHLSVSTNNS